MIAEQRQQTWVIANVGHNPSRIRAAVNGVPEEDKPILVPQTEPVHQRSERGEVAVDVANGKDTVAGIKATLEVGFQRVIPSTMVRRELFLHDKASFTRGRFSLTHASS